jgi:hypothetical protein
VIPGGLKVHGMDSIAELTLAAIILSFLLSYFLKFLLDSLLGMIRSITIISHLTLISVVYPEKVQIFFNSIQNLVSYDLI